MSAIFTEWHCNNCKKVFNQYVSFGEPIKNFYYKWKCPECKHYNLLYVRKFLDFSHSWNEEDEDAPIYSEEDFFGSEDC